MEIDDPEKIKKMDKFIKMAFPDKYENCVMKNCTKRDAYSIGNGATLVHCSSHGYKMTMIL